MKFLIGMVIIAPALSEELKQTTDQTGSETKPKETPSSGKPSEGWFIGLRGAYVPSAILEVGYQFNNTFKLRLLGQGGRYYQSYSVDG